MVCFVSARPDETDVALIVLQPLSMLPQHLLCARRRHSNTGLRLPGMELTNLVSVEKTYLRLSRKQ